MSQDLYSILGVKRGATADEIRAAYKKLAKTHHPDRNPGNRQAEETFKQVSAATMRARSTPRARRPATASATAAIAAGPAATTSTCRTSSATCSAGRPAGRAASPCAAWTTATR
jgi:hypothetical protein